MLSRIELRRDRRYLTYNNENLCNDKLPRAQNKNCTNLLLHVIHPVRWQGYPKQNRGEFIFEQVHLIHFKIDAYAVVLIASSIIPLLPWSARPLHH